MVRPVVPEVAVSVEPPAPMVEPLPEPVEPVVPDVVDEPPDAPIVEPEAPLAPEDEPAPMVLPPAPLVPVLPMGVPCELCWPAPVAALGLLVVGGVPWAMAVPTTATVAKPASNVFSWFDVVISETP